MEARMTSRGPRITFHSAIGIDISKTHLDVCCLPERVHHQFTNDASGLAELAAWVSSQQTDLTVFEASGTYHRALERVLSDAGLAQTEVRLQTLQGRLVIRQAKARRVSLKRQIKDLESEIAKALSKDAGLQRKLDILT